MASNTRNPNRSAAGNDPMIRRAPQQHQRQDVRRWQQDDHGYGPFAMMRDMQEQIDHWFNRFGISDWTSPSSWMSRAAHVAGEWMPAIDAFQRGNEFIIRADVPGMTRNDISVEIGDDTISIRGERKSEANEDREGMYWTERSYGSFTRVVPLPPGAISDSAKANFHNGVLEITVQAPSQEVRRGRKIDITTHEKIEK